MNKAAEAPAAGILANIAKELDGASKKVEDLELKLKSAKAQEAAIEKKLVDQMINEQVKSFRAEGLGGFRTEAVVYPNVKDREALTAAVKKNKKWKFLVTETIHGTKLKSFIKELLQQGQEIPPGIDPYTTTEIRRFK